MTGLADWGTWMVPLPASLPGERVPVLCMAEQMRGRRLVASGRRAPAGHWSGRHTAAARCRRPVLGLAHSSLGEVLDQRWRMTGKQNLRRAAGAETCGGAGASEGG